MKKLPFTIVEMIVVIGVIAILMGLIFPAVGAVKQNALRTQSLTDVKNIQMAVKSFKNDYHYLPSKTTGNDEVYYGYTGKSTPTTTGTGTLKTLFAVDAALHADYTALFDILCANGTSDLNPKKTKFLTPTKKYFDSNTKVNNFRDPSGSPYIVYLDTNYDGKIELPGSITVNDDAAVVGIGILNPSSLATKSKNESKVDLNDMLTSGDKSKIVTSWQ